MGDQLNFPDEEWERVRPEAAGMDPGKLQKSVSCALEYETPMGRDVASMMASSMSESPAYGGVLGPTKERGGPNGLVIRGGRIVAEWGDTSRVDMTFSVSKSFLSVCAGLAFDRGLIRDVHDPAGAYCRDGGSILRTMIRSPGNTFFSRPANGKEPCGASRTSSTATGRSGPSPTIL